MDAQERQESEEVPTSCAKNLDSILKKINSTKLYLISIKPKDAIKLFSFRLDKTNLEENIYQKMVYMITISPWQTKWRPKKSS